MPGLYELYDLEKDPLESANMFGHAQAEVVRGILDQFVAWAKSAGDDVGLELAEQCRKSLQQ